MEQDENVLTIAAIDKRRSAAGVTARALYEAAGVSHRTYYDALNGRRGSNVRTLQRLEAALARIVEGAR